MLYIHSTNWLIDSLHLSGYHNNKSSIAKKKTFLVVLYEILVWNAMPYVQCTFQCNSYQIIFKKCLFQNQITILFTYDFCLEKYWKKFLRLWSWIEID